jgi:hypothetical protein
MTPKTILALITEVEGQGGYVERIGERQWDFFIARRAVGGAVFHTRVATVGYYVTAEGKNRIGSSVHEVRDWIQRVGPVK